MIEEEEDDFWGINDLKPILKKSLPDRKKKGKKKNKGSCETRMYDEMIEGVYHSFHSELDLEIQFSEPM